MLTTLQLLNFRAFRDHEIPFGSTSVLVGRSNAGKSTVVDALRLISLVINRLGRLPFRQPPFEYDIPQRIIGITPSTRDSEIEFAAICHRYGDPPAIINAKFDTGYSIQIFVDTSGFVFGAVFDSEGHNFSSRAEVRSLA